MQKPYTQLTTRNGQSTSRLTFGTMQFGGNADASESRAMYEAVRHAGITHFDTAMGYTDGRSERLIGEFIKHERDNIFLATKVGYVGGASRKNIITQFEICKRQLQEDAVDLLYMHRFDEDVALEETFETLTELQSSGAIRYIGVSNYAAWQVMKAQGVATSLGTKIDVIQPMYSLVKRQAEVEIIPMAQDQDIRLIPYSPLGAGLLTGKYSKSSGIGRLSEDARYKARYDQPWMHKTANDLAEIAADMGIASATLAVAWAAAHPAQPSPIISARSALQLKPSLAAEDFQMTQELYEQITALSISPAPATDRLEEG
ncbi:aldo/keto reductase [Lentilitoribacter sp. Alg239-R112]|uniref:aldo/keto reductase n=1 Tax=Lentilitoribacter sp. Alg239-R112 TaxID=2305987 RepID=UPI0013A6AD7D|nr:aldo/keto reductase [Lentilitoribacter sp. Alg239-R112]